MMSNDSDEKHIWLPKSHFVESDGRRAKEWREAELKKLDDEHEVILAQAKTIAEKLDQTVFIIHLSELAKDRNGELGFYKLGCREVHYAIRLDNNMWLRREAVFPDGTMGECEEYN